METVTGAPAAPAIFQAGVVAVIGVGLIGGSVVAALRQHGAVEHVLGVGRNPRSLEHARQLGLIDQAVTLQQAAQQADLIILATPVCAIESILAELEPCLRPETLVTDVGSTKADIVQAARLALGAKVAQFVPGHPVAGAETPGPESADAGLYQGRNVVLTPLPENSSSARQTLTRMWERCGARVIIMTPEEHDTVLASVSHVPHFLSSVFMGQVAAAHDSDTRFSLAATGFRDFTRIAAGSPEVWRDILLSNRTAVLAEIKEFKDALAQAEQSLQQEDAQGLHDFLERAALARRFWGSRSGLS